MKTVPLTCGKVAVVDDSDYPAVSKFKWTYHPSGYAIRRLTKIVGGPQKNQYLHRFLMDPPPGLQVDHINWNGLDNRRNNLRLCNNSQNHANRRKQPGSSKFRGVSWSKSEGGWCAHLTVNYRHKYLGRFEKEIDAAKAYDAAARFHFGEFANLNFKESV